MTKSTTKKSKSIKLDTLKSHRKNFLDSPRNCLARNMLTGTSLADSTCNWERVREINHEFSDKVPTELKVTNQNRSGRCWLFAALNLLRLEVAKRYKLDKFELSQSYLFFWDKLEKANYFLESVIQTADQPVDSRLVMHLFSRPLDDGGQWHHFVSLVDKYGVVPQSVYPDSKACCSSPEINTTISLKLRACGEKLRAAVLKKKKAPEIKKMKDKMIEDVHRMLCIHLGAPPTKFCWEFKDKNKKFDACRNLTPKDFFKNHVKMNLDDYICLVNSPRKVTPFNKSFTVEYLGNVIEGKDILYLNVPIEEMRGACVKSLKDGEAIWFGCDVGQYLHRKLGVMDLEIFDYNLIYDTEFTMDKEGRMNHGESMMTHAMLFTGVNMVDGKPNRWRVENSWGDKTGEKGYYIMTDKWFDEYMFEVAVHKKYLPKKVLDLLKTSPIVLPAWDPLGALAR